MNVKLNDNVLVLTGKDKGKTGKVIATSPKAGKVTVEGVNIQKKHQKARKATDVSGIVKKEGAIRRLQRDGHLRQVRQGDAREARVRRRRRQAEKGPRLQVRRRAR